MSLSSLNRNMLRLTGMASGMDTESIITSLLKLDQMKLDKQIKAKTKLEWKGDLYRDINLKLRNFREKFMSTLNPENNVFSSSAFNSFKVSMATQSNAVSVVAGSNAFEGSHTINSITQLASAAEKKSADMWSTGTSEVISLDSKLSDVANKFTKPLEFATRQIDDGEGGTIDENYISFSINGEVFEFKENQTLNEIITTVNSNTKTGVRMSYSSLTKSFSITQRNTGEDNSIEIINIAGNAFADNASDAAFGMDTQTVTGNNAKLTIDGIYVERNTNSFAIDGVQYSLNRITTAQENTEGGLTFNITRDVEPTIQKIKAFIEGYNSLLSELETIYNQRPNRDYSPLTSEEKSSLSEADAEQWTATAKEGLLYRDNYLGSIITSMRSAFYDKVEGTGRSAAEIGLQTGFYYEGGKINVNESALREALLNNPEQVKDVFTKVSSLEDTSENASQRYKESGLITRISDLMISYTKQVNEISLSVNSREIEAINTRMEQLERWLAAREDRYWKQFTAMETALSNMQSQSAWLTQALNPSQSQQ